MKRRKVISIAIVTAVVLVAGLRVWASRTPVQVGPIWNSIEKCAENQKFLYQSLEAYVDENGRLPDRIEDFKIRGYPARITWKCPVTQRGYNVFLENYGDPNAVLIADQEDKHPTTFMLWFRGYKPQVQTMGDGTIHLFEDGELMTMRGSR